MGRIPEGLAWLTRGLNPLRSPLWVLGTAVKIWAAPLPALFLVAQGFLEGFPISLAVVAVRGTRGVGQPTGP